YRLQRVSTIFQTFNLIPSMTVEDNVALPLTLAGVEVEERRKRARHLLDLVGLENRATSRAGRLSGGEQQKVAVARALANRPGLILADEPTGSLDSTAGEGVLSLLDDLNRRGATVVLVTHDPEVARHARRVIRMIDGRAVELDAGKPTVRTQEPVDPPARMHWRDTVKVGLGSAGHAPGATPAGALVSLPQLRSSSALPSLAAGRLPSSDAASEVLLPDSEAVALGYRSPPGAVGTHVKFSATYGDLVPSLARNKVSQPVPLNLLVVGIVSNNYIPAGAPGALAPYGLMRGYWSA